jgi:glutamate-1-semialdehyde 2,1-aminomutase
MKTRDHTHLLTELAQAYAQHSPRSRALNERASRVQVDGGSHALRLVQPFPPRIVAAKGAWIKDEDGHDILDFWQGHLANLLGHNSQVVTSALAHAFEEGFGLQTGFTDRLQAETAEMLCQRTGAERARFTTSGALATMYAIIMARAHTGRDLVLKVGGGWHGAQPWGLKGVSFHAKNGEGFRGVESAGLPATFTEQVMVTSFNDTDMLRDHFRRYGDGIACFIVEPFLGVGGFVPATREYLRTARELTQQYGSTLILDEVISGFRFRAGDVGALYDVQPDLATFGKIMGGGMPVAAVVGRADIMGLVGRAAGSKVKFSGGTYSAHPASLMAAKTMLQYLIERESQIYPRLAELGHKTRQTMEAAFIEEGLYVRCLGDGGEVLHGGSMFYLHFPYQRDAPLNNPEEWFDPTICDGALRESVLGLAFLLEDVFMLHSHGGVSTAHTDEDIEFLGQACRRVARRIKSYL